MKDVDVQITVDAKTTVVVAADAVDLETTDYSVVETAAVSG